MVRVAIDVRSLMEGRLSGVEIYTIELLRALTALSPQTSWHLFYNSWKEVSMPEFSHVTWEPWRMPNILFNAAHYLVGQPTWDTLVSADVFFMPHMRLMPLRAHTPLVVTAHDLSFERFPEFYSRKRRLWHHLMRPRHLLQRADHIIAVSAATARDLVDLYEIEPDRISIIHSGVSLVEGGDVRAWRALPARFILYLGTLEPRKNVVSLIEAFSAIADTIPHDLVLAGAPGWLTEETNYALRHSPYRHRIHQIGFVPDDLKYSLYRAAELFVYPSFWEGFGFPPLESLVAGTPVITAYNSALPEVVGQWATLIDPYKPSQLATALQELLQHPRLVSAEVSAKIRQQFSWEAAARSTFDLLRSIR